MNKKISEKRKKKKPPTAIFCSTESQTVPKLGTPSWFKPLHYLSAQTPNKVCNFLKQFQELPRSILTQLSRKKKRKKRSIVLTMTWDWALFHFLIFLHKSFDPVKLILWISLYQWVPLPIFYMIQILSWVKNNEISTVSARFFWQPGVWTSLRAFFLILEVKRSSKHPVVQEFFGLAAEVERAG